MMLIDIFNKNKKTFKHRIERKLYEKTIDHIDNIKQRIGDEVMNTRQNKKPKE